MDGTLLLVFHVMIILTMSLAVKLWLCAWMTEHITHTKILHIPSKIEINTHVVELKNKKTMNTHRA